MCEYVHSEAVEINLLLCGIRFLGCSLGHYTMKQKMTDGVAGKGVLGGHPKAT